MSTSRNPMNIFLASSVAAAVHALQFRWATQKQARDHGVSEYTPASKSNRISVAEGKRRALKARNVRRHKLAMKRSGRR